MLAGTRTLWIPMIGSNAFPTSSPGHYGLIIKDTSPAGTPTYVFESSNGGGLAIDHDSQNEAQVVTVYMGDELHFDIDQLIRVVWTVKLDQATMNAATSIGFGVASAQNDTWDSIASMAAFRVIGASASVVAETDDGTTANDNDDVATGKTLANAYKTFEINFSNGKSDVRFFIEGEPVATSTTFSMAALSSSLQPFLQFQKSAAASTDGCTVKELLVEYRVP